MPAGGVGSHSPKEGLFMHSTSMSSPRLLEQVRELIRIRHYSIRTEQAYVQWIKRYILFHGKGQKDRVTMLAETLDRAVTRSPRARSRASSARSGGRLRQGVSAFRARAEISESGLRVGWQYVFPPARRSIDPRSGMERRHHVSVDAAWSVRSTSADGYQDDGFDEPDPTRSIADFIPLRARYSAMPALIFLHTRGS